jgi:hypothetical protein
MWATGERKGQCIAQKGRSGLMQQGRNSSGGQGLPDRAAEEQVGGAVDFSLLDGIFLSEISSRFLLQTT